MPEHPTDQKLITAKVIANLLSEMPLLEEEYERAKHKCVPGTPATKR